MVNSGVDSSKNVHPILVDSSGRQIVTKEGAYTKVTKYIPLSNTNETTVWDPTSGTKFVLTDIIISADANGICSIRDGTAGSTIILIALLANNTFSHTFATPLESTTADNLLTAQVTAASQYIMVCGYEL